jgi:biopolymer transport protein ExbD
MAGVVDGKEDSTFELNLAPMLDIIVSIVPMLLLSVAFVQITVIDTPVPQAVEKAIAAANEKNKDQVQITLRLSKTQGYRFSIVDGRRGSQSKEMAIALKGDDFDTQALHRETLALKKSYPDVFRLEIHPAEDVALKDIVAAMDSVRSTAKSEPKVVFNDVESGKPIETDLMFPDVVFGNVTGG